MWWWWVPSAYRPLAAPILPPLVVACDRFDRPTLVDFGKPVFALVLQGCRAGSKNHRGGLGQPLALHPPVPARANPCPPLRTCPFRRYADT